MGFASAVEAELNAEKEAISEAREKKKAQPDAMKHLPPDGLTVNFVYSDWKEKGSPNDTSCHGNSSSDLNCTLESQGVAVESSSCTYGGWNSGSRLKCAKLNQRGCYISPWPGREIQPTPKWYKKSQTSPMTPVCSCTYNNAELKDIVCERGMRQYKKIFRPSPGDPHYIKLMSTLCELVYEVKDQPGMKCALNPDGTASARCANLSRFDSVGMFCRDWFQHQSDDTKDNIQTNICNQDNMKMSAACKCYNRTAYNTFNRMTPEAGCSVAKWYAPCMGSGDQVFVSSRLKREALLSAQCPDVCKSQVLINANNDTGGVAINVHDIHLANKCKFSPPLAAPPAAATAANSSTSHHSHSPPTTPVMNTGQKVVLGLVVVLLAVLLCVTLYRVVYAKSGNPMHAKSGNPMHALYAKSGQPMHATHPVVQQTIPAHSTI